MVLPPETGPTEEPYHKMLRLREEAAGWEVKAHRALLEARKLEAKAARLSIKARKIADSAEAHAARAGTLEAPGSESLPEPISAADKELRAEKARQLEYEAEALRQRAKGVESQATQIRIAARAKIDESTKHLQEAKRIALAAEALRGQV